MKLTEAKEKWCPMARVSSFASPSGHNRLLIQKKDGDIEMSGAAHGSNCLADGCAMWVWDRDMELNKQHDWFCMVESTTHGHCALRRS